MALIDHVTQVDIDGVETDVIELADAGTAGYQEVDVGGAKVGASATGLANDATVYNADVAVDGEDPITLAITGSTAQTYTNLLAQINTDLGDVAVATLEGGNIRITSATTGVDSTIEITDDDLFMTLTDFDEVSTAVDGEATGGLLTVLPYDSLSESDKVELNNLIVAFGDSLPIPASPGFQVVVTAGNSAGGTATGLSNVATAAGYQTAILGGDKVGATATGLSNTATAAGFQVVNVGGATAGGDPTGLVDADPGYQTVNVGGAKVGGSSTGLTDTVAATSGSQEVDVGGNKNGASATGLANDATVYTASVVVDGGAPQPISITGDDAQTYTTLLAELNADTSGATWSIAGGNLLLTSDSTGDTSTIAITDTDLFDTLTGFVSIEAAVPGEDEVVTTYTATITVDGVAKPISLTGASAQTYTDLLAQINADLGVSATASLVGGNLRVTSATSGATSTVSIVDSGSNHLFESLTNFDEIEEAVDGIANVTYTATILVNGAAFEVALTGDDAETFTDLLSELNAVLGSSATASITSGDLRITSATTGPLSTVEIVNDDLFKWLTGFVAINAGTPGTTATTYTANILIDGTTNVVVSAAGTSVQTFTQLLTALNTALGANATAALNGGNLRITSATTGINSSISMSGNLIEKLAGFEDPDGAGAGTSGGYVSVPGTAAVTYKGKVKVDGTVRDVSFLGTAAQTFTNLLTQLNTDLSGHATVTLSNGNLLITSDSDGAGSTVEVVRSLNDVFSNLSGAERYNTPINGATGLYEVLELNYAPNGQTYLNNWVGLIKTADL